MNLIRPIVSTTLKVSKKVALKVFAASAYEDPLKRLILAKGHSDIVAARQLGDLIWNITTVKNISFDYIVPIPLHWTRFAYRGFNQAEEIARIIAHKSGKPMVNLLKRSVRTVQQSTLSSSGRSANVKNAFIFSSDSSRHFSYFYLKRVLLVDDLMTTGSTLAEATRLLSFLPLKEVVAVVACRVV
jgi:ComF family protein